MIIKFNYKDKARLAIAPQEPGKPFIQVSPEFGYRSFKPGLMMNIEDANIFERTFARIRRWIG